jgi:hypothetical protein
MPATHYPTADQAAAIAKTAAALATPSHYGKRVLVIVDDGRHEFQTPAAAARFLSGCVANWSAIRPFRNMNGQGTIDLDRDATAEDAERAANLAEAVAAAAPPKAEKVGDFRGVKTYRFGRWLVTVTRTTHSTHGANAHARPQACTLDTHSTRREYPCPSASSNAQDP